MEQQQRQQQQEQQEQQQQQGQQEGAAAEGVGEAGPGSPSAVTASQVHVDELAAALAGLLPVPVCHALHACRYLTHSFESA